MSNLVYFKCSPGPAIAVLREHQTKHGEWWARLDAFIAKHGAIPGRCMSAGEYTTGLFFAHGKAPAGWRKARDCWTPNRRLAAGRAIAEEMKAIVGSSNERLAVALGCPTFFRDLDDGGQYCGTISWSERGGTYYLMCNRWCVPDRTRFPGIVKIPASEWHAVQEAIERGEAAPPTTTTAPDDRAEGKP